MIDRGEGRGGRAVLEKGGDDGQEEALEACARALVAAGEYARSGLDPEAAAQ